MPFQRKVKLGGLKELYYTQKMSAPEVAERLGVALSTVYDNMRVNNLARRSPEESNKLRFEKSLTSFNLKSNLSIDEEKLKIAGLMLYSAEGTKAKLKNRNYTVEFTNSNPRLIKIFVAFLRNIYRIDGERLRGYLFCYPNQDAEKLQRFWSDCIKIPLTQFTKPYIRKYYSKKNEGVLRYGVLHVRYSDKRLLEAIEEEIKEYSDQF